MTDNNDLDTNVSEISSYLVFQCIKCRLIVGDSMSFQNTSKEANTIILSSASNIKRTGELFTSKSGFDVGSTFFSLCCTGCDVSMMLQTHFDNNMTCIVLHCSK
jgi:hypothetical protein